MVDEQGGYKVVSQGSVVVSLHAGQAGPGVGDVLFHGRLAHGCVQLLIDLSHLQEKGCWAGEPGTGALTHPGYGKRALSSMQQPVPEAAPESGSNSKDSSCCQCQS